MRELELIESLERTLGTAERSGRVVRGIGDDAAVVRGAGYAVTSVDAMVQDIHFRTGQLTPAEIGHRALAGALSDLAAMGARPGEAYLALGLPPELGAEAAVELVQGAQALAQESGVCVAGGDVTTAPALTVSFTVVGWSEDPGALVGRDVAAAGDLVGVTGRLGGAGAGLALLDGRAALEDEEVAAALARRYALPRARLREGRLLARAGARAMIDLSDGLASDCAHLARRSGVRLELSLSSLPLEPGLAEVAAQLGRDARELAATAGEDYELCVCLPPSARAEAERLLADSGTALTWIGRVLSGKASIHFLDAPDGLSGYEHSV